MNLLALIPILGINIPTPVMSVGMKLLQTPGVIKDGAIDVDFVLNQLPALIKEDEAVTKSLVKVGLKGLGVAPAAADLAIEYTFASDGERTEQETEQFTQQFRFLNSPIGRIELPFGCKECNRIHYSQSEIKLAPNGKPLCVRCNREIPL